jgi:Uma2 family endonuclease
MMSARAILTYDDYAALPDDGRRYELYEGELIVTPSPRPRHQTVIGNLYVLMVDHVRRHALGEVFLSPIDVILSRITVVQPDLVYVERSRLGIVSERAIEGAPTLVVEVLSPSTSARDRGVKQVLYAEHRIPYYWIVDPLAQTMQALRRVGESYEIVAGLDARTAASLPPLTDLTLDPAAVWRPAADPTGAP